VQTGTPMATFVRDVLRSVTWHPMLLTQSLGLALAVGRWFEGGAKSYLVLLSYLIAQSLTALLITLAALAGDQAVRRGWPVWRAVAVGLTSAAAMAAAAFWGVRAWFGTVGHTPDGELVRTLGHFLDICAYWGMAMMVFLNGRSAARMLAGVRATELERVQVEQRLLTSRLAAAEAQIDPGSVLRRLAQIRDSYAAARSGADEQLEALITSLRRSVTQESTRDGLDAARS
jgi:hypothetical protein